MVRPREMRSPHYHRGSDTPDTIDYPRLELLAESLTAAFLEAGPRPAGVPNP
jgi:hypothetical protein